MGFAENVANMSQILNSRATKRADFIKSMTNDDSEFDSMLTSPVGPHQGTASPVDLATGQAGQAPVASAQPMQAAIGRALGHQAPSGDFKTADRLDPNLHSAIGKLMAAIPGLGINSGYRSPEQQQKLYENAIMKYGSEDAARRWVAPAGHSNHNKGEAVDLRFADPSQISLAHKLAAQFGLSFPLSNENWHVELAGPQRQ